MLPDYLKEDLDVVFVGTSVATASASRGHYYAGPGNKFWEFLWEADLTGERLLGPEQDAKVLEYRIGLTDVVKGRASSSDSLLRSSDYDVPGFIGKIEAFKPFVVAFNRKQAAKKVFSALRKGEPQRTAERGRQRQPDPERTSDEHRHARAPILWENVSTFAIGTYRHRLGLPAVSCA